jgi:hypothetical protein
LTRLRLLTYKELSKVAEKQGLNGSGEKAAIIPSETKTAKSLSSPTTEAKS